MKYLLILAFLLVGCKGTKVYPLVEIGHERSHDLETRAGLTFVTGKGNTYDLLGGYRFRVSNHEANLVQPEGLIVDFRFRGGSR